MKCVIKNIIRKLCEDCHSAMVEKRTANHLPIEDVSPYEIIYSSIIKEFERVENENTELRECIKNFLGWWDREDNSTPPHDTENPQKYVDAMRSSLEGVNHAND